MYVKEQIVRLLEKNDEAVARGIVAIHDNTAQDGIAGFGAWHKEFCTSLAMWVKSGRKLSPKQLAAARKIVIRYADQLTQISNRKFAEAALADLNAGKI